MGKADFQNNQNSQLRGIANDATGQYNSYLGGLNSQRDQQQNRASDNYNDAVSGYQNFQTTGGFTAEDTARLNSLYGAYGNLSSGNLGALGLSVGGGGGITNPLAGKTSAFGGINSAYDSIARPDYSAPNATYSGISAGGGYDPTQLKGLYGNVDTLSNLGKTGGVSADDVSNVNRSSLTNLEATGGYSPQDLATAKARAASSSPSFFANLKDQLDRNRVATGNVAGGQSTDFKLARTAAQQKYQDELTSDQTIQQDINKNKMAAGSTLAQNYLNLIGQRNQTALAGASGALSGGTNLQQNLVGNELNAAGGLSSNINNLGQFDLTSAGGKDQFGLTKAGGLDQFTQNYAQMQMAADQANASAAASANAQRNALILGGLSGQTDLARYMTDTGISGRQYGTTGLSNLYGTNLGSVLNLNNQIGSGLGSMYDTRLGAIGAQRQPPSFTGTTLPKIIGAVGSLGGLFTQHPNTSSPGDFGG